LRAIIKAALINSIVCNFHANVQVNVSGKLWKIQSERTWEKNRKISWCRFLFLDSRFFRFF